MKIKEGQLNIAYVWNSFRDLFGEPDVSPKKFEPKFTTLPRNMNDREILDEYKPEELTLDELAYALKNWEKAGLLRNGYANIFYIRDKDNSLWAVDADWSGRLGGWHVRARSVTNPFSWNAGRLVVSRNKLSDTKTLSEFVPRDEFDEFKKKVENILKI